MQSVKVPPRSIQNWCRGEEADMGKGIEARRDLGSRNP